MQINLPPGVSEERMERMAREHDPKTCLEGNNADGPCAECAAELAEIEYDSAYDKAAKKHYGKFANTNF